MSVVVRRAGLTETMSSYLIRQIEASRNIVVRTESDVVAAPVRIGWSTSPYEIGAAVRPVRSRLTASS